MAEHRRESGIRRRGKTRGVGMLYNSPCLLIQTDKRKNGLTPVRWSLWDLPLKGPTTSQYSCIGDKASHEFWCGKTILSGSTNSLFCLFINCWSPFNSARI
jgi:hypothetical protein